MLLQAPEVRTHICTPLVCRCRPSTNHCMAAACHCAHLAGSDADNNSCIWCGGARSQALERCWHSDHSRSSESVQLQRLTPVAGALGRLVRAGPHLHSKELAQSKLLDLD
jgi:hypothetical protein